MTGKLVKLDQLVTALGKVKETIASNLSEANQYTDTSLASYVTVTDDNAGNVTVTFGEGAGG